MNLEIHKSYDGIFLGWLSHEKKRILSLGDSRLGCFGCLWPLCSLKNIKIGVWGLEEQGLSFERGRWLLFGGERLAVMGARTSPPWGITIGSSGWNLVTPTCKISISSRIPHEGLASAMGSSPKKVKATGLGEKQALAMRSRKDPLQFLRCGIKWF